MAGPVLVLYLQRIVFAYYIGPIRKWKMYIENLVGEWHLCECLSWNYVTLRKFQICTVQFSEKVLMLLIPSLYFLLPRYSRRISHSTDIMLTVDTGRVSAFFLGRENCKV